MPSDQPNLMWKYWRDKYGYSEALREYFPNAARQNDKLRHALVQIDVAHDTIDAIMSVENE